MKILTVIANYGVKNNGYLQRLIQEYNSMSYSVDILILSDRPKNFGPNIKVIIGLPSKDPWTLAFGHKKVFADNIDNYDLFIYSEDDILIEEKNIRSFLEVTSHLPEDEIVGFFRFEGEKNNKINYPEMYGRFHWDTCSLRVRGEYTLANFSCEHSACYIATQKQLRKAINSGGFLVDIHEGRYDLLCTAATDIYTQCGMKRLLCVSHIDEFLVHHLPNKYIGSKYGIVGDKEFRRQVDALMKLSKEEFISKPLFETETIFRNQIFVKSYYEPINQDIIDHIPGNVNKVLSIGCGWGAMEGKLVDMGKQVVALPIDRVISGAAASKGVKIINGDFVSARKELSSERFDCLLLQNVLHLVDDPVKILSIFLELLEDDAIIFIVVPNMFRIQYFWRKLFAKKPFFKLMNYQKNNSHPVSDRIVKKWLKATSIKHEKTIFNMRANAKKVNLLTLGLLKSWLCSDVLTISKKRLER